MQVDLYFLQDGQILENQISRLIKILGHRQYTLEVQNQWRVTLKDPTGDAAIFIMPHIDVQSSSWHGAYLDLIRKNLSRIPIILVTDEDQKTWTISDLPIVDLRGWDGSPDSTQASPIVDFLKSDGLIRPSFRSSASSIAGNKSFSIEPIFFLRISDSGFSGRLVQKCLHSNLTHLGDVVQLRLQEFRDLISPTERMVDEVENLLSDFGVSFGTRIEGWPPYNINQMAEKVGIASRLVKSHQTSLGAVFRISGPGLVIDNTGDKSDYEAADDAIAIQLHHAILDKAKRVSNLTPRLSNQIGWGGIDAAVKNLCVLLDRPTSSIPNVIGGLYSIAVEVGSFVEMDDALSQAPDASSHPLDPDVRRPVDDLIRTLAPWLRRFPSIRAIDIEAMAFNAAKNLVEPAIRTVRHARDSDLIDHDDTAALLAILASSQRGALQSQKATNRGITSARNLVLFCGTILGTVMLGSVENALAPQSIVAQRAAAFIAEAERSIISLAEDLPRDLKIAITGISKLLSDNSAIPPESPRPNIYDFTNRREEDLSE